MSEEFNRSSRYPTEAHGSIPVFRHMEEEAEFLILMTLVSSGMKANPLEFDILKTNPCDYTGMPKQIANYTILQISEQIPLTAPSILHPTLAPPPS